MGIELLSKAGKPVISVARDAKVLDAVRMMVDKKIGAVVILKDGRLEGIFTERDLMSKVVAKGLPPESTPISAVMTSPVIPVEQDADPMAACQLMKDKHIRHLPVVNGKGEVLGMLSIRHLLEEEIDELKHEVEAVANYAGYDGSSG